MIVVVLVVAVVVLIMIVVVVLALVLVSGSGSCSGCANSSDLFMKERGVCCEGFGKYCSMIKRGDRKAKEYEFQYKTKKKYALVEQGERLHIECI